ncbi:MALD2 protein, partial [Galbula dea]|nr:MALD2 protein [Galbula dea]
SPGGAPSAPVTLCVLCVLKPPPARPRHVIFEDEVMPLRRPSSRVTTAKEGQKLGFRPVPSGLCPQSHADPDYVVRYPAIRSPQQREGYKGVFQDQLAEYTDLLQELRAMWQKLGKLKDLAFLEKQQRCEYLKKKLTHIKARIQEYDHDTTAYF